MNDALIRQLIATMCRLQASLRMYWPEAGDAGQTITAGSEYRFGPYTGGQVLMLFTDQPVRIIARPDELPIVNGPPPAGQARVPANLPIYQFGVHVYVIRPGPSKYLYVAVPGATDAVVGVVRGDTDITVR